MTTRDFTLFFLPATTNIKLDFANPPRHVQKVQLINFFYPYNGTEGVFGHFCIQTRSTTHSVGRLNKNNVLYTSLASGDDVIFPYIGSCPITLPGASGTFAYDFDDNAAAAYPPPLCMLNDLTFEVSFINGGGYASSISVTAMKCIVLTVRITAEWDD